ncbi:uncharacterized protein LOC133370428 [Rhineura floridana]|uniref:uncharacterized protein LOC133370428 n=1 Tax=Rhineura floridana TaxID=261503 RepID=UPI002AC7E80A|nr:uncharacterized protein LOC133370428 [Rhineura floridana]XP_061452729.1 uncharacterized protein LOC133370428 [Rhineura floridana]
MQTSPERIMEAHPTSSCEASTADDVTRNNLISKPSPRFGGSTCKPEAGEQCLSGRVFLKRRCPFWRKRKGTANPPQGQEAPKSHLCVEDTHEGPIQAVRKPATWEDTRGLASDEESVQGRTGTSLLRKLLCLKATSSRLQKPPHNPEASPVHRASVRCGPVAALSRTADPPGESPLRWKPGTEVQSPADATSVPETAAGASDTVDRLVGLWMAKPWRAFRAMMASRAKKRSALPEDERSHRGVGESDLCPSAQPETSPVTRVEKALREPPGSFGALEDQNPPSTFPSSMDETYGAEEVDEGGCRSSWHGMGIHGQAGDDISDLVTEREVNEICSFLSEGSGLREENPAPKIISEWEGLRRGAFDLPGGNGVKAEETAMEDEGPVQGDWGSWVEISGGEDQDLADLAENPGGQGMVMATRDLGWLNSELLGGPVVGLGGQKSEGGIDASTGSYPETQRAEGEHMSVGDRDTETKPGLHLTTAMTERGSCLLPLRLLQTDRSNVVKSALYDPSGARFPGFLQDPLKPLESPSSFAPRGSEQGIQEGLPTSASQQDLAADAEACRQQGSPTGRLPLPPEETEEATAWLEAAGPEAEQDKRLIYLAAVEIVGTAINKAAEQLGKVAEQEQGELGSRKQVP